MSPSPIFCKSRMLTTSWKITCRCLFSEETRAKIRKIHQDQTSKIQACQESAKDRENWPRLIVPLTQLKWGHQGNNNVWIYHTATMKTCTPHKTTRSACQRLQCQRPTLYQWPLDNHKDSSQVLKFTTIPSTSPHQLASKLLNRQNSTRRKAESHFSLTKLHTQPWSQRPQLEN